MGRDRESKSASRHHHHHRSSKKSKKRESREHELPRGVQPISEDDYFLRATEFRVWLAKTKDKYVEDLSTEQATALFRDKFMKKWNRGALEHMYYSGIPEPVLEQTRRTKHTWGFAARLNESEKFALATARDSVGVATRKSDLLVAPRARGPTPAGGDAERTTSQRPEASVPTRDTRAAPHSSSSHKRKSRSDERHRHHHGDTNSSGGDSDDASDDDDRRHRHRHHHKSERKKHRKHHESVLEELAPKPTGRDAVLEKRRAVANKLHGAARDREENRDGLDLSDDFLMGGGGGAGGGSDLQRRLQAREHARDRKQQEQHAKLAVLEAKESARMDKFLQDMGLSASSKPITIAPRNP